MNLKPLGDRVIVQAIEEEETTASGIVLPDTAKEKPQRGKVLAVGDGAIGDDGERTPVDVAEGDEVLYSKYGGTEITVDGDDPARRQRLEVPQGRGGARHRRLPALAAREDLRGGDRRGRGAVSYTHLTLPTILLV